MGDFGLLQMWRKAVQHAGFVLLMCFSGVAACVSAPGVQAQEASAPVEPKGPKGDVREARLGVHPDFTRFVLELTASEQPRHIPMVDGAGDTLSFVVPLDGLRWDVAAGDVLAGQGLIKEARFATGPGGTGQVVLTLKEPARVKQTLMLPPRDSHDYRFVLDLEKTSRAQFLASAEQFSLPTGLRPGPVPEPEVAEALPLRSARPETLPNRETPPKSAPLPDTPPEADAPAAPLRTLPADSTRQPVKWVVVLDPGHGGHDPGALGHGGTLEKDIVLQAAKEMKAALEASGLYDVYLTRTDDTFLPKRDRVAFARARRADLFLSLHADSLTGHPEVRGTSVYTLSETASDKEAEALAERENAVIGMPQDAVGDDVVSILIDLAQRDTMNSSVRFARTLLPHLNDQQIRLLKNTHRFAGFAVLTAPDVPSVLIELGYLSNAQDESLLTSKAWRKRIAAATLEAVNTFFAGRTAYAFTE